MNKYVYVFYLLFMAGCSFQHSLSVCTKDFDTCIKIAKFNDLKTCSDFLERNSWSCYKSNNVIICSDAPSGISSSYCR